MSSVLVQTERPAMMFKHAPSGPLNRMPVAVEKINPVSFIDGWKKVVIAFTAPGLGRLLDGDSNGCSVNDTSFRIAVTVRDKLLPEGKRMDLTPSTICFSFAVYFPLRHHRLLLRLHFFLRGLDGEDFVEGGVKE